MGAPIQSPRSLGSRIFPHGAPQLQDRRLSSREKPSHGDPDLLNLRRFQRSETVNQTLLCAQEMSLPPTSSRGDERAVNITISASGDSWTFGPSALEFVSVPVWRPIYRYFQVTLSVEALSSSLVMPWLFVQAPLQARSPRILGDRGPSLGPSPCLCHGPSPYLECNPARCPPPGRDRSAGGRHDLHRCPRPLRADPAEARAKRNHHLPPRHWNHRWNYRTRYWPLPRLSLTLRFEEVAWVAVGKWHYTHQEAILF